MKAEYICLIYERRNGGLCIGAVAVGDLVVIIDNNKRSSNVKILHPEFGSGFVTRAHLLKLKESECK